MVSLHDPVREQLAQTRRNQILDAAMTVFAEKGFHRATTREIAETAGVAEGTIYNYFAGKDDLLIGLMVRLTELESLEGDLTQALDSDSKSALVSMFRYRIGRIVANHNVLQAVLPEILTHPRLRERFYRQFVSPTMVSLERYMQARIQRGEIRPINVPLATRVVQSTFVGLFIVRMFGDETLLSAWEELPEVLATIIFDGLAAGRDAA